MISIELTIIITLLASLITALITGLSVFIITKNKTGQQLKVAEREKDQLLAKAEALQEKDEWAHQARQQLRDTFDALAAKALQVNADQYSKQAGQGLKHIIEPLRENLSKLDEQVRALENRRAGAYESLSKQVENLLTSNKNLNDAALSLTNALRSTKERGKWGEVQLRRIVEMAGMVEHVDFSEQKNLAQGDKRPDMLVRLPNKGIIPVDAKAPMEAYLDAQETQEESVTAAKLQNHARALRNHMKNLAQRVYWDQFEVSPDFVVMLVPYESGLSAAFSADPALLEDALQNRVFIVSPVTLLALLKISAMGWMQVELAKNAHNIARQGSELSDRFNKFMEHFSGIGKNLDNAVSSYNKAVGSAETRVVPALRKLNEMGVSSNQVVEPPGIEKRSRSLDSTSLDSAVSSDQSS